MYDIVIVGGGIAGMTAAIYGLRAGKKSKCSSERNNLRWANYFVAPCGELSGDCRHERK